ncbi:MAG TPA: hypothetical protein PKC19_14325 [Roseiflexaceae bacterium]|nr:hypothetical protein [Roseiflexaceae bacterium]
MANLTQRPLRPTRSATRAIVIASCLTVTVIVLYTLATLHIDPIGLLNIATATGCIAVLASVTILITTSPHWCLCSPWGAP